MVELTSNKGAEMKIVIWYPDAEKELEATAYVDNPDKQHAELLVRECPLPANLRFIYPREGMEDDFEEMVAKLERSLALARVEV